MADPIDTDAERDDACHCRDVVSVPGPKLGVTYHFSDCRVDEISALCDEVDRLRAAIAAIPRHRPGSAPRGAWLGQWTGMCGNCRIAWPCPTEQAHIAAEEIRKALGEGT